MIGSGCGKDVSVREWNGEMKAPLGVEYQWIDMLIYGVLMMTYILMAMDVDNEGVWRAPSTKSGSQGGGRSPPRVAFASGMVDGVTIKVWYVMPSVVVVMHIHIV